MARNAGSLLKAEREARGKRRRAGGDTAAIAALFGCGSTDGNIGPNRRLCKQINYLLASI